MLVKNLGLWRYEWQAKVFAKIDAGSCSWEGFELQIS